MRKIKQQPHHKREIKDNDSATNQKEFISYCNYLRKKQEAEMKILQTLEYNFTQHKQTTDMQNELFILMKHKGKDETGKNNQTKTKKTQSKKKIQKSKLNQENKDYQQIDPDTVVINKKLIYLKDQPTAISSNDHLLHLLKHNNLSNKEYLKGKKQEILAQITQNQSEKQNQIIKDYILRNMNEQNNAEVVVQDRFYQVKHQLFS